MLLAFVGSCLLLSQVAMVTRIQFGIRLFHIVALAAVCALFAGTTQAQSLESAVREATRGTDRSHKLIEQAPGREAVVANEALQVLPGSSRAKPAAGFPDPVYKTSGREFYMVMPSVIGNSGAPQLSARSIYIASRSRTPVRVSYLLRDWEVLDTVVPGKLTRIDLPTWGVLSRNQSELAFDLGLHIEAQDVVTVYGYSHEPLSSDGFLVLPKESLGQHYFVASARNALNYYGNYFYGDELPRGTAVPMAIEDNTTIQFKLTSHSYYRRFLRDTVYTIVLNRGEVFPLFARDTGVLTVLNPMERAFTAAPIGFDCDLTGTEIWSDKPIAVFSGHERASAADALEFDLARVRDTSRGVSRDHLIEQMTPVELWGKEFVVMGTLQNYANSRPLDGDVVRIISSVDGNQLQLNGNPAGTIDRGEFYEFMSNDAAHIVMSEPAMVVKYMQTTSCPTCLGDPDMTVVQPVTNLSTAYSLPVVGDPRSFSEYYVNVIVHRDAQSSLKINGQPPQTNPRSTPHPDYVWYREYGKPAEWRIESAKPCYAETYAFGRYDGYTFAGGGDFKYQDSLFAENLDFKTILVTHSKELEADVTAGLDLDLFLDSITIFDITWQSGDTNHFVMVDVPRGAKLGPADKVSVKFRFNPTEVREYRARATVWSSSRKYVYIDVVGIAAQLGVEITPPVIDFGRVRVNSSVEQNYNVIFTGDPAIDKVTLLASTYPELASLPLGFHVNDVPESQWEASTAFADKIRFTPMTEGWRDTAFTVFAVLPQTPDRSERLRVRLIGRGVQPNVVTENQDFGEIRINRESGYEEIVIRNLGSDTTHIKDIRLESGDVTEFEIDPTSMLSSFQFLDTSEVEGSTYTFRAKFKPTTNGPRTARVRIETLEGVIYSELTGVGVEPFIVAIPPVLNFGSIPAPKYPNVATNPEMTFTIQNTGSYEGIITALQQASAASEHFELDVVPNPSITIEKSEEITVNVTFKISTVGDFTNDVVVVNDSRNQPLVSFIAEVTTDPIILNPLVDFDTVRDCNPVHDTVYISNDNAVGIQIDKIEFGADAEGFGFGEDFLFPIKIPPGVTYPLVIEYNFPPDRLDGKQTATVILFQQLGDQIVPLEVQLEVYRDINILSLSTQPPAYTPNAGDNAPFRLPIKIVGDFIGVKELDNFVLKLKFNNELFKPVGIDRTGSLTESNGPGEGSLDPFPGWDEAENTYTVRGSGLKVSERSHTDLLFTVLMTSYVTSEITAEITPELNLDSRPCSYAIEKFGTGLFYADDCGDEQMRDVLEGRKVMLSIMPEAINGSQQRFRIDAGVAMSVAVEVVTATGARVLAMPTFEIPAGDSRFELPVQFDKSSGLHILRAVATDGSRKTQVVSVPFNIVK